MAFTDNLTTYVERVADEFRNVYQFLGIDPAALELGLTTTATDIVGAINELKANTDAAIGDVNSLTTTATDLSAAINELKEAIGTNAAAIAANVTAINAHGTAIADNDTAIASNASAIAANAASIATNASNIASNSSAISTANTNISAINAKIGNMVNLTTSATTLVAAINEVKGTADAAAANAADTTYVDNAIAQAIANLTDSAPGTLDTLNEIAAALGDDPNFATTITEQLALKASAADVYTKTDIGDITFNFVASFETRLYGGEAPLDPLVVDPLVIEG